jgi:hypothetical protein
MHRPSLLHVTVVLLLAAVGLMAVAESYQARHRRDVASQPEVRPAVPLVEPSGAVPELTPDTPHQLAPQPARPATAKRKRDGLTFEVVGIRFGRTVALRSKPGGRVIATAWWTTEYGSSEKLAVAARRGGWLGLTSSDVPNGKLGWVRAGNRSLEVGSTRVSLRVDLSRRVLELRDGKRVIRRARVGIGRSGSATPTGPFSITDELKGKSFGAYYGCCILALSGHQMHTPAGWRGGTRLAIHGTNDPRSVGVRSSAGCLHADADDLRALIRRAPLGTPVFINA